MAKNDLAGTHSYPETAGSFTRLARRYRFSESARRKLLRNVLIGLGALLIFLVFATPYLWMIGSTFKARAELFRYISPLTWRTFIPLDPTMANIQVLLSDPIYTRAIFNSLGVSVASVALALFVNSMFAYVLGWLEFPGRNLLFIAVLATMLISMEAKLVPLFLVMQNLNLNNTYAALVFPFITDAFLIFLLRQHFRELPRELFEAAILDGCSYFQVFWRIMLPLVTPALVSAAFIKFIFSWDAYMWPLVTITDNRLTVLTVALARLYSSDEILWELVFAGSFIATIPVIILFIFLQRYYVEGIASAGLKG
jgi:ABC-type glycerol-3-phosphate transport system permease component